jgi:hypothetical protein
VSDDVVEVFCDGSVTNAVMTDAFTSHLGDEYVGRAMVVIPALDFGVIEQTRVGVVTKYGTPASNEAEAFAIRAALAVCSRRDLAKYIVFSDCQGAVALFKGSPVQWRSREQMYLPNSFFDRVLGRAGYLRQTKNTVGKRNPVEPHQTEAFELFQAPRQEFKLSESPLWARVVRDARRHEQVLGVREPKPGGS